MALRRPHARTCPGSSLHYFIFCFYVCTLLRLTLFSWSLSVCLRLVPRPLCPPCTYVHACVNHPGRAAGGQAGRKLLDGRGGHPKASHGFCLPAHHLPHRGGRHAWLVRRPLRALQGREEGRRAAPRLYAPLPRVRGHGGQGPHGLRQGRGARQVFILVLLVLLLVVVGGGRGTPVSENAEDA